MDFSEEEQTLPLKEDEASQKSYINLKIGNAHIPIEVKCLYRARFFQEQLQETFSAFISNKVIQEDLEAVGISLDNQVFPNLFKYLAAILDEQMIVCLDEEFGNDSSNKGITDLTAARKKYEDYFSKEINSTEEFSKRHAELFKTNRQVCKNFHNAQLLALKRIKNDIQLLKNSLLKNLVAPIKLKQISSSGSDFHKQGQQVLILTFSDKNKKIQKIIYKPSPLEADALLLGDIQQLAEFDPGFRDHFSLIELLNEGLGPQEKLPTYLIIPRKDGDLKDETVSRLNTYYGYLEYLSHDPWKEPDYENIISSCLEDPF